MTAPSRLCGPHPVIRHPQDYEDDIKQIRTIIGIAAPDAR